MDNKPTTDRVFIGDVTQVKSSARVKFTLAELEEMKKYATEKGSVYVSVVLTPDKERFSKSNAWASVYDPRAESGKSTQSSDVPF
tara:strand:- start:1055 stop:1309 length:255 start_codon:yes stop_codon:yes gene_type:complete